MRAPGSYQIRAGAVCAVATLALVSGSIARRTSAAPVVTGARAFGFWGLNGYQSPEGLEDLAERFNVSIFQTSSADPTWAVSTFLPMVRAAGLRVTLRMTPSHHAYTTADGDFDLDAWKERLAHWQASGVQAFIDDGTLAGHMVLDDIRTFPGEDPDGDELDEMARYSEELMPGLMTFTRADATDLPVPRAGTYLYLDATVNQYLAREGSVEVYATREATQAAALGLGVIGGLNICDGGDGSSGQPGWRKGHYAMSAAEITRYGTVLAKMTSRGIFLAWEYDAVEKWPDGTIGSDYFDRPDVRAALAELGALMASQPSAPLLRPSP